MHPVFQVMPPLFQFIGPLVQFRSLAVPLAHRWKGLSPITIR